MTDLNTSDVAATAKKRLLLIVAGVAALGLAQWQFNIIPMNAHGTASVPTAFELPTAGGKVADAAVVAEPLPSSRPARPRRRSFA